MIGEGNQEEVLRTLCPDEGSPDDRSTENPDDAAPEVDLPPNRLDAQLMAQLLV